MTNKTLTEKRFKELIEENNKNYFKRKFEQTQKFLGTLNKNLWIIGAIFFLLTTFVLLSTGFIAGVIFFAQNEMWKTFHLVTTLYDVFSNGALFFLIGAGIIKLIKHIHKKRGINYGK